MKAIVLAPSGTSLLTTQRLRRILKIIRSLWQWPRLSHWRRIWHWLWFWIEPLPQQEKIRKYGEWNNRMNWYI